jgi:hypothetical protein
VKVLKSKEFWIGAVSVWALLKFGGGLPVVGPYVGKLK